MNKKSYILISTLFLVSASAGIAEADTAIVGKTADSNNPLPCTNCSLREAVNTVNHSPFSGQSNIFFTIAEDDPGCTGVGSTQVCRITLNSEITIGALGPLVINGPGANRLTIHMGGTDRIFRSISPLTIRGVILEFGQARGSSPSVNGKGSAIYFDGFNGPLTLDGVVVQDNDSTPLTGSEGSIYYFGGTDHSITNSSFTGNRSANCGAFVANSATVSVLNSTISGNTVFSFGGGVCVYGGTTKVRSSTIAGNTAGAGGGFFVQGGTLDLGNTMVAGNTGGNPLPGSYPDFRYLGGTITTAGGNLIGINSDVATLFPTGISQAGDRSGDAATPLDPLLAPLGNYGGITPTRALGHISPAIDHGMAIFGETPEEDQRGGSRDHFIDIGAFEFDAAYVGALPMSVLNLFYVQVITTNDGGFTYCVSAGALPPGLAGIPPCPRPLAGSLTDAGPQAQVAISGTPTVAGIYPFTITATSGAISSATNYQIAVSETADDFDLDNIPDDLDNCLNDANFDQRDTDGDGIGSLCDQDLSNDCFVNFTDLATLKSVFFTPDDNGDFDGSGSVDFLDLGLMKARFFTPPGPSGVPNLCDSELPHLVVLR